MAAKYDMTKYDMMWRSSKNTFIYMWPKIFSVVCDGASGSPSLMPLNGWRTATKGGICHLNWFDVRRGCFHNTTSITCSLGSRYAVGGWSRRRPSLRVASFENVDVSVASECRRWQNWPAMRGGASMRYGVLRFLIRPKGGGFAT